MIPLRLARISAKLKCWCQRLAHLLGSSLLAAFAFAGLGEDIGAAVNACVEDGLFTGVLFAGRLFSVELLDQMLTPDPVVSVTYALGIVVTGEGEKPAYGHDGGSNGVTSWMQYFPENDTSIIIRSNYGFAPLGEIINAIVRTIFVAGNEPN